MKASEILPNANLQPVSRGRMKRLGWYAGYLVVEYPTATYIYGPQVAEAERDKLLRVPHPDHLLIQLRRKNEWKSYKVDSKLGASGVEAPAKPHR
jgi:hypothetical protein